MKKIICLILTVCCLSMLFCAVCYGLNVNSYLISEPQLTAVTLSSGYSVGFFEGEYFYDNSNDNYASLYGVAHGSSDNSFLTGLYMDISENNTWISHWGGSTQVNGSNHQEHTIEEQSKDFDYSKTIIGNIDAYSYKVVNSSDRWDATYTYRWVSQQIGWQEP